MNKNLLFTALSMTTAVFLTGCGGGGGGGDGGGGGTSGTTAQLSSCKEALASNDTAYTNCMIGTYSGKTVADSPCSLTYGGPGKPIKFVAGADTYTSAAFEKSQYSLNVQRLHTYIDYNSASFPTVKQAEFWIYKNSSTKSTIDVKYINAAGIETTTSCIINPGTW